eukprot:COSAG01_NODE_143_length_24153_cov_54.226116_1_plen_56_part_00
MPAGTGEQQEVRRDSGRCAEAAGGVGQQEVRCRLQREEQGPGVGGWSSSSIMSST